MPDQEIENNEDRTAVADDATDLAEEESAAAIDAAEEATSSKIITLLKDITLSQGVTLDATAIESGKYIKDCSICCCGIWDICSWGC